MSIKRGRVIILPTETKAAFEKSFQKGDGSAKSINIRNVNVPVFNGQTFENDGRGHNTATLLVNFDKMSNYGGKAAYLGSAGPNDAALAGKSDAEIKAALSPVYVDEFTDVTEADPKKADKVRISIDPKALAAANYAERVNNQKDGAPAPRPETADRLPMRFAFSTTNKGVAGMTAEGFSANVAKAAQQRYILTASAKNPSANMVSAEDIRTVGKIFADEYKNFAKKAVEKGCDGINPMKQGKDGKMVVDKSQKIEGTSFEALSNLGLNYAEVDGAAVIGCAANQKDSSAINKALVAFNTAFNAHMSQVINGNDTLSADAKRLGNMMGVNAYSTMPPHTVTGSKDVLMIQPSAVADIQPFSGALQKAYDAAMHDGPNGVAKTPAELYGQEVLDNAQSIMNGFDKSIAKEAEDAKNIQASQYDAVAAAVGGPEYN